MNTLKNHLEKVIFGLVAIVCAVFAYTTWQGTVADAAAMAGLEENREKIKHELDKKIVTDRYAYGPAAVEKINYEEKSNANHERGALKVEEEIPANVAYPMLPRPYVDPAGKPIEKNQITRDDPAELLPLGEVKAEGDHGRVFVTFRPPKKMKYLDPVRIEVFRGEDAKSINQSQPYGTVELGPEENPEAAAGAGQGRDSGTGAAGRPAGEVESGADKRRRERREAEEREKEGPRGREKKEKATEEIPAEFADLKVFPDTVVYPRKTYYYQVRLVARMNVPEGKRFEIKDANGTLIRILVAKAPKNAQTVPGAKSGVVLYATPLSEVVSATTPDNFQIRLAGFSGKVDPPGTPEYIRTKNYKARIAVRVWVTEGQSWEKKDLEVAPGELLKGTLNYKPAGSNENKAYEFDSGYRLVELKQEMVSKETKVEEAEVGPDGKFVIDPDTKQPKKKEKIIKSEPIPVLIAVLENLKENRFEEFPERADFQARAAALEYYRKIAVKQQMEKSALQPRPK